MTEKESPFLKRMRAVESPMPHLAGAADTLKKIIRIQRDLVVLDAQLKAARQARRLSLLIGSGLLLHLALLIGFFWIFEGLSQIGWGPVSLALLAFLGFGIPGGLLGWRALRAPAEPVPAKERPIPPQGEDNEQRSHPPEIGKRA